MNAEQMRNEREMWDKFLPTVKWAVRRAQRWAGRWCDESDLYRAGWEGLAIAINLIRDKRQNGDPRNDGLIRTCIRRGVLQHARDRVYYKHDPATPNQAERDFSVDVDMRPSPEYIAAAHESYGHAVDAMRVLTDNQRACIEQAFLGEMTIAEVARERGTGESSVADRVNNGLQNMRIAMGLAPKRSVGRMYT